MITPAGTQYIFPSCAIIHTESTVCMMTKGKKNTLSSNMYVLMKTLLNTNTDCSQCYKIWL